jgi:hypothetical protein
MTGGRWQRLSASTLLTVYSRDSLNPTMTTICNRGVRTADFGLNLLDKRVDSKILAELTTPVIVVVLTSGRKVTRPETVPPTFAQLRNVDRPIIKLLRRMSGFLANQKRNTHNFFWRVWRELRVYFTPFPNPDPCPVLQYTDTNSDILPYDLA